MQDHKEVEVQTFFAVDTADIWKRVQNAQRRAKTRTLDCDDVETFIEDLTDLYVLCKQHDIPTRYIFAWIDGGAVSNNHKYTAQTTEISFYAETLHVERVTSRRTSYGRGIANRVCLRFTADTPNELKRKVKSLGFTCAGGYWSR